MRSAGFGHAVVADNVHKWYRVYSSPFERIKRVVGAPSRHLDFRALDDVSFAIRRGAAVGVIGENGAGKSTLLKLIAGTTRPTAGTVEVEGSVAAILELGAAFHPEFTGRDNAILYGSMLGIDRPEMERRLDDVFGFAELGEFVEHPIKCYSTGMQMRLAFAVATHVDPDVLVVDEALAVGDGYFQKKCVDRILEIRDRGTTILFCSHSMYYVSMFCERVIWLRSGRVAADGPPQEVVTAYEEFLVNRERRRLEGDGDAAGEAPPERPGQAARIVALRVLGAGDRDLDGYRPGEPVSVELEWEAADPEAELHLGVALERGDGMRLVGVATFLDGLPPLRGAGVRRARVCFPTLPMAKGHYAVTGYLFDRTGLHIWDEVVVPDRLKPASDRWQPAVLQLEHRWETP